MRKPSEKLEALFEAAVALETDAQRADYLNRACPDPQLRREVEALLEAHRHPDSLFEEPTARVETTPAEGVGTLIGRYKLLEALGEGGFGAVWLAEQKEPVRRKVALKVIKLGMDTKQVVARFEAERQALALMDHPNIAKVFDAGTTESGRPYCVMELVRGIPITRFCDENSMAADRRLDLFIKVCHAVQHAHQKGIIHRDLKPSNVLVTLHDGVAVPKIIDFGIAKATHQELTDKTIHTLFQQFIGTPAYVSPEQAEMSGLDIDTRSDIYSLGVLLYELLTGKTPFDSKELLASGLDEMRRTIREQEPVRPSTRLNTLPGQELTTAAKRRGTEAPKLIHLVRGDLDWIVMKCLEKDRTRRYETANGLALDIERHLNQEPVDARPESTAYRVRKFVRRNKLMVTAAAAVAGALVVGTVVSAWQAVRATRAEREQNRLRLEAVNARDDEANQRRAAVQAQQQAEAERLAARQQAYAADMELGEQALAMNDRGLARRLLDRHRNRPGETDLRGWEWRYLWAQCQSEELGELCRRPNSVYRVAYDAEGKRLAVAGFARQGEFVGLWDVPGGTPIAMLQTNAGHLVTFSPRGDLLAADNHRGLTVWRANTLELLHQLPLHGLVKALKFSPDGGQLAALSHAGKVTVWNIDQVRVAYELVVSGGLREEDGDLDFSPDGKRLAVGHGDGRLRVIDLDTGSSDLSIEAHNGQMITAVAWAPTARILATGSGYSANPIRIWDTESGRLIGALEGHTSWISRLVFSADGQFLYSASGDQTIRIWDVQNVRCLRILTGSGDEMYGLALSPDGTTLASGAKDGAVAFWSALPQSKQEQPRRLRMQGTQAAFSPSGRCLAVPCDGVIQMYELPGLKHLGPLSATGTNVAAVAYSPDGTMLAGGGSDGWLRVWSTAESRLLNEWLAHKACVGGLRFTEDGSQLVSGSYSPGVGGELACWDARTGRRLTSLLTTNAVLKSASPDGRIALASDDSGQLRWWQTGSGQLLAATSGHKRRVIGAAFSTDGSRAASVAEDGTVALWDVSSFSPIASFKGHMLAASAVTFSPDGRRLATCSVDREAVKVWDLATVRELVLLRGEGSLFDSVVFSPDGNWLAACSSQGQLHVWEAPSLEEIATSEALKRPPSIGRRP
ncbi:MAG TPA: protein kinase [Verrucomicrobiae bacterium]